MTKPNKRYLGLADFDTGGSTMGDVANLPQSLLENLEFITDCARYAEGLLSEQAVKKKYRFNDDTWDILVRDEH